MRLTRVIGAGLMWEVPSFPTEVEVDVSTVGLSNPTHPLPRSLAGMPTSKTHEVETDGSLPVI